MTKDNLNKLKDYCISLEVVSVYDIEKYSVPELLYLLGRKMNELVGYTNDFKNELIDEVESFENTINQTTEAFKESVNSEISNFQSAVNGDINNFKGEVNSEITDFKNSITNDFGSLQGSVSQDIERQNALLQGLLDSGLSQYVVEQMEKWEADGTLANIIGSEIFQDMHNRIDGFEVETEAVKQSLTQTKQEVNSTVAQTKQEVNAVVEETKRTINEIITETQRQVESSLETSNQSVSQMKKRVDAVDGDIKRKSFDVAGVRYIAHRGLSAFAPENTVQAFVEAGKHGYKYIETDVSELADGEFCIMHDSTVDRTTNGTGNVSSFNSTTIKNLIVDTGSWSGYYNNLKVPMLSEYLEVCKQYNAVPVIEIKNMRSLSSIARLYQKVAEVIDPELCIFASFDISQLREVVKINENVRVCLFINPTTGNMDIMSKVGKNPIIGASYELFSKEAVKYAHSVGLKTNIYTVNDQAIADSYKEMQVDFITTDSLIDSTNEHTKIGDLNDVFKTNPNLKTDVASLISNAINKSQAGKESSYRLKQENAVHLMNANVVGKTPFENFNTNPYKDRVTFLDKIYFDKSPSLSIAFDNVKFSATVLCYDENDRYLYDLGWIPRSGMTIKIPHGASYGFVYFRRKDGANISEADIAEFISGGGIVSLTPGVRLISPSSVEWASVAPTLGNKYATIFASEPAGTRAVSNVFYTNGANTLRIMKADNVEISVLQFNSIDALIKATNGWETKNADIRLMNECVYFVLYLRKTDNTNILNDDYLMMFDVKCSLTNK